MPNNTSSFNPVSERIEVIEVSPSFYPDLASPWRRILAVLINLILFAIVILPFSTTMVYHSLSHPVPDMNIDSMSTVYAFYAPIISNMMIGFILFLMVLIWQWVWMGKNGQSVGKWIMHIKVVDLHGRNPGFNGTVLLREISFYFLVLFVLFAGSFIISFIGFVGLSLLATILINILIILFYFIPVACLIMLFISKIQRRSLQDFLAKTIVIKVPKKA